MSFSKIGPLKISHYMVFKVEEFDMMYMYVHEELIANYSTWNTAISPSKSSSDGLLVVSSSFSPPCPSPAASLSSLPSASVLSLSPSPPALWQQEEGEGGGGSPSRTRPSLLAGSVRELGSAVDSERS